MLLLAIAAAVSSARMPPVDQCMADKSFVQFRADLRRIIESRDTKGLLSIVADDVHASLGGDVGKKDFIQLWSLDKNSRGSLVWRELGDALRFGCTMRSGVATVPSFGDQFDADRDPFETFVALPGAILRQRKSDRSGVVARLRWDVLTLRGQWDGGPWVGVRLDDGRKGYVRETKIRSPIGYRAWFEKRGGRWKMAGFLAGD